MSISFIKSKCNPHTYIHSLTLNELFRLKKNWKQKNEATTRQKTNWANVHFVNLTFFFHSLQSAFQLKTFSFFRSLNVLLVQSSSTKRQHSRKSAISIFSFFLRTHIHKVEKRRYEKNDGKITVHQQWCSVAAFFAIHIPCG